MSTPANRRPISQSDRDGIINYIKSGLFDLFFGDPGLFRDRPGFIAGGGVDVPLPNIVRAISQANCRRWAAADKTNFSTRVNLGNAELCTPYLDSIGELPPDGEIAPPFEGGQCDGQLYIGRYEYGTVQDPNSVAGSVIFRARGPLSLGLEDAPSGAGVALYHRGAFPVNQGTGLYDCDQPFIPPLEAPTFTITAFNSRNGRMVALQPCGFTDNCGDPPSDIRPPDTIDPPVSPQPPQITIQLPGFGDLEVTVNLDEDGNPVVCIPEFDECFTIIPPSSPGDVAPLTPGTPGTPSTTGSGGESSGTAPAGSELTGVLVEILTAAPNAARFQNNSRQPFRGAGYIAMGYPNLLGVDMSGGVINIAQFFHAQQRGCTAWRVTANIGFNLRSTPYYRTVNPD